VVVGATVELKCYVPATRNITWTFDTNNGYVDYIFWQRQAHRPWLEIKSTAIDIYLHSLVIFDAQHNDSGLYDCYDDKGQRIIGYNLTVIGMCLVYVYTPHTSSS